VSAEKGWKTNENLRRLVDQTQCGKVYGSALAGLLRNWGKGISGNLGDLPNVVPYSTRTLIWVLEQMPNLRAGRRLLGERVRDNG